MIQVLRNEGELRSALDSLRSSQKIGFVPTMGALHPGHGALLRQSKRENPITVLSIFVNPTQFGPNEDFSRYPRTFEADLALAEREGVNFVFAPSVEVMYPAGSEELLEVGPVAEPLCGRFRPGHFRGVATVVHRLFSLVQPHVAYFGQKDLQQCLVVQEMVRKQHLPVQIEIVPTVREIDGLAMSSRNRYLSESEREKATVIFRAMREAKRLYGVGERNVSALLKPVLATLATVPEFTVQYCEIRGLPDLQEIEVIEGEAALAIAGFLGKTRLIDNVILRV